MHYAVVCYYVLAVLMATVVFPSVFIADGAGGVGAAVVDHEALPVLEGLPDDAVKASRQVFLDVIDRDDY